MLPAAHPGEMNLTSMNGERRLRLSQKFMEPPGTAQPDCLIAADIANTLKAMYQARRQRRMAARFDGFEWKTEEDAFNDGFRRAGNRARPDRQPGRRHRTTSRPTSDCVAGNNGVQLPIKEYTGGKLVGTEMLYMDGKFDTADGKAVFKPSPWPGLPKTVADSEGKAQLLDQQRPHQRSLADRLSRASTTNSCAAAIQWRSSRSTRTTRRSLAMASAISSRSTTTTAPQRDGLSRRRARSGVRHSCMFAYFNGMQGDVTTNWTDRNIIPYYKGTWADIRRVGSMEDFKRSVSFKSRDFA